MRPYRQQKAFAPTGGVSDADLFEARRIAARVTAELGEKYWPLFDRLDREYHHRQKRHAAIEACLNPAFDPETPRRSAQKVRGQKDARS